MKRSLLICLLVAMPAAAVNIVDNGDFEFQNIGTNFFVSLGPGNPTLTGWTIEAPSGNQGIDLISSVTGCSTCVNTGSQSVDLAGSPGPGSIYQDLATIAGHQYVLTFFASSNVGPYANAFSVEWDGLSQGSINTPAQGSWQQFQFSVTATSNVTRLRFIGNLNSYQGGLLDTVSVEDVTSADTSLPEPSTLLTAVVGIALVSFGRFRRGKIA